MRSSANSASPSPRPRASSSARSSSRSIARWCARPPGMRRSQTGDSRADRVRRHAHGAPLEHELSNVRLQRRLRRRDRPYDLITRVEPLLVIANAAVLASSRRVICPAPNTQAVRHRRASCPSVSGDPALRVVVDERQQRANAASASARARSRPPTSRGSRRGRRLIGVGGVDVEGIASCPAAFTSSCTRTAFGSVERRSVHAKTPYPPSPARSMSPRRIRSTPPTPAPMDDITLSASAVGSGSKFRFFGAKSPTGRLLLRTGAGTRPRRRRRRRSRRPRHRASTSARYSTASSRRRAQRVG